MKSLLKWSALSFLGLMLLCTVASVRYSPYTMDGDAVSFLDMSRYIQQGKPGLAVNGYWNPGYSVALAIGDWLMRPSRYQELFVNYAVNGVIFGLALWAVWYLVQGLVEVRESWGRSFALPPLALAILGWGIVFGLWQQELSVVNVRSDGLLLVFLVAAAGFALRLLWTRRMMYALLLGVMLAGAYYTKAFGFVASMVLFVLLVAGMLLSRREVGEGTEPPSRVKPLLGVGVAALLFLALVAPYIAGISRQRERLTIGDSSRLLYAWFIDGATVLHEAYNPVLGKATNHLKHPERRILEDPVVYSYQDHLNGTMPVWFDPAWWHDNTTPHSNLPVQVRTILRELVLTCRFVWEHGSPAALLALMFLMGYRFRFRWKSLPYLLPVLWGTAMWMVYLLIEIEPRYVDVPLLLVTLPLFAALELRDETGASYANATIYAAVAMVLMFAATTVTEATNVLSIQRRLVKVKGIPGGWYEPNLQEASRELDALGVHPGESVACNPEMYYDPYLLYLSGVQIVAELPGVAGLPAAGTPADDRLLTALRSTGAKAIVVLLDAGQSVPEGWQRLGHGQYCARLIR